MSELKQILINLRDEMQQSVTNTCRKDTHFIDMLDLKIRIYNLNIMVKHLQFFENVINSIRAKGKQK
ncbi:MAG: hypothetical protein MJ170_04035 [Alphaproteobacteria bacterium]|nr:hypothetical protein [Alphaproteobacteria bacterium]